MFSVPPRGGSACALMVIGALLADPAQAQNSRFDVRGVIADSAGTGLQGAMVVALTRADSVLTKYATTNSSGSFTLRRLLPGEYILQVSSFGYQTSRKDFSVIDAEVDAGTINLNVQAFEVDSLVVSVEQVPIVVKRDTLNYNARAFGTRPNATVEDLLRRLPGIEVEADGSIKAQGEDVENVLVEGKEFFGSDPTIATQNLPADAVERVQVYDKQSDMAEFTGIPDGEEERTINLELKEGAKVGYFGRMAGGLGADAGTYTALEPRGDDRARYDGTLSINRFSLTTQLAGIANVNNVNRPGFSWGDYLSFIGGSQGLAASGGRGGGGVQIGGGRDDGFTETLALGLNASHELGAKSWVRSSYFVSRLDNLQNRVAQQQQLLGSEVSSIVNQTNSQTSDNLTFRLNLNAQHTFTEGHDLRLRANLTKGASTLGNAEFQETQTASGQTVNSAVTDYDVDGDDLGGFVQLTWRKRLSESGRSIVAEARGNLNEPDLSGDLSSTVETYDPRGDVTRQEVLQEQSRSGRTLGHTLRLSLTEPLGRGHVLELFGERSVIDGDEAKSVYDLESGTPIFNELLSSSFNRTYTYLRGGLRFNRNTKSTRFVFGLQVQGSDLDVNVVQEVPIANRYTHFLPWANLRIQFKPGRSMDIRYSTSTREPTVSELQPFVDNSDPLNLYVGNPDLAPEYNHRLYGEYRFFDQFSFANLFTHFAVTYTSNKIVGSRFVIQQAQQVITSVNSDHGWSTAGGVNYGMPIRAIGARLNLNYRLAYSTATEFVDSAENVNRVLSNTFNAGLENRAKDIFDVRAGGGLTFNNVTYSLNKELNQKYITGALYANGTYYLGDAWTLNMSLNYRVYDQDVFAGPNVALLEASVSRLFMGERAEIQLVGVDLLNENQGVNITNSSSYIQEERIQSLGRYLMLKFIYRLGPSSRGGRGR